MADVNPQTLTLAPDASGWMCGGEPWCPAAPFYAVLGDPIAHSLSPLIQGAALRAEDIPFEYRAVRIEHHELALLLHNRSRLGLAGFNVTAPHKRAVADLCGELTDTAREAGAVNTVRVRDKGWVGHNTDVGGIREVLSDGLGATRCPDGLVLGAGGAARAAVVALVQMRVESVRVLARPGESRDAMRAWLAAGDDHLRKVSLLDWVDPPGNLFLPAKFMCVSCVSKNVESPSSLVDPATCTLWLDMNYGDGARLPRGLPRDRYRDGLSVLLGQGALSFTWWFDRAAPRRVMSDSLDSR
jgi:shikimate dehydrogenase